MWQHCLENAHAKVTKMPEERMKKARKVPFWEVTVYLTVFPLKIEAS